MLPAPMADPAAKPPEGQQGPPSTYLGSERPRALGVPGFEISGAGRRVRCPMPNGCGGCRCEANCSKSLSHRISRL